MNRELVEPADLSLRELAIAEFSRCCAPATAPWLADVFLELQQERPEGTADESVVLDRIEYIRMSVLEEAHEKLPDDEDAALLRVLLRAPSFWNLITAEPVRINGAEVYGSHFDLDAYVRVLKRLIPVWQEHWRAHDWSRLFLKVWTAGPEISQIPEYNDAAVHVLVEAGLLKPVDVIDVERLRTYDRYHSSWTDPGSPDELEFWMHQLGPRALLEALQLLKAAPSAHRADIALGILGASRFRFGIEGHNSETDQMPEYAAALREGVDFLGSCLEEHDEELPYLGAYWWAVRTVSVVAPESLGPEESARAAASAKKALGRFRQVARAASADEATEPNRDYIEHYGKAPFVIAQCEGLWPAMKALILVLRALTTPAVAPDLRARREKGLVSPPIRWSWIPENLLTLMHACARREQRTDPALEALRTEFARFCLERLRTRHPVEDGATVSNEDMTEPDVSWRTCYIRAIRELRANPKNRGHQVLHWSFHNDPDEGVRRAAKVAYGDMTKGSRLPEDMSPRRPVVAALWWLRQAHLLALNVPIDKQGARRTRQVESQRTHLEDQTNK